MIYFTSDTHFHDHRLDLMNRPFKSIDDMHEEIDRHLYLLNKDDILFHLGDITYSDNVYIHLGYLERHFKHLKCRKILIRGNYDILTDGQYIEYGGFESVHTNYLLCHNDISFYLTHKPEDCASNYFNLCGHIHGAWKIQRNMVNVGVDVWHYKPVSIDKLVKTYKSICDYHDKNAFAGELGQNFSTVRYNKI